MPGSTNPIKSIPQAADGKSSEVPSPTDEFPTALCNGSDVTMPEVLSRLKQGELLMVDRHRRNGLILYKEFYAEFAGPGAAVGSVFDEDCRCVIPVGDLSLLLPQSHKERQEAFLIRRQWIKLTQQFTDESIPLKRAQMILEQFENYFSYTMIEKIPDEAFALMVGVLPHTVRMARRPPNKLNVKAKV